MLDYLCGGELFTHLSNVDHFSEWRTKFYAAQIVLALGHLHELEVIYRDLKPENLVTILLLFFNCLHYYL